MKAGHQPIIVIRRGKKHHAFHGGAWKVAYADFVTAMMAFFLVMWLSAQDTRVKKAIAGYFQQSGVMPHETSNSIIESGNGGVDPGGLPIINRDSQKNLESLKKKEQDVFNAAAQKIKDTLTGMSEIASLRDQVEFTVTDDGLRIELIEKNGSSFFKLGSPELRGESIEILAIIAQELGHLPNDVVMEGHTDRVQYPSGAKYGNFELSTDRANAARRVMDIGGLKAGQVKATTGFADTNLRVPQDPLDPRNRRVSILVKSQVVAAAPESPAKATVPGMPAKSAAKSPEGDRER